MRVIILSWEYPPRIVGQLALYVSDLAANLSKNKVETYVVTYHDFLTGLTTEPTGVYTFRVANPVHTHIGVLTWDLTLNQEIERAAATIYYKSGKQIDLIDVYEWHFIPAAVTLKYALGIPFVYSVDSLEEHRSPAANSPFNMAIKGIEWLGFYEASKVIAKTEWMKNEIIRLYNVPPEKIKVVSAAANSGVKSLLEVYRSLGGSRRK